MDIQVQTARLCKNRGRVRRHDLCMSFMMMARTIRATKAKLSIQKALANYEIVVLAAHFAGGRVSYADTELDFADFCPGFRRRSRRLPLPQ